MTRKPRTLQCEANCTALSPITRPDGWPMGESGDSARAGGNAGSLTTTTADRPLACSACDDDSDADIGKPCTDCAAKGGAR